MKHLFTRWIPNILLVAGLLVLVRLNLAPLAFVLLVVSKWQLWLGGPKAWLRNIRDASCDLVVALSAVSLLVLFNDDLPLQAISAGLFAVWLLVVEPLQSHLGIAVQAGICQLLGLGVLFLLGRTLPELVVIATAWVVGLVAADHFLTPYKDPAHTILVLSWGLLVAELSWLSWRWLIVYPLLNGRLLVPQISLLATILGYVVAAMYIDHSRRKLRKLRLVEYVALSIGLLLVVIFGTNWDTRL